MNWRSAHTRRNFLISGTIAGSGLLLSAFPKTIMADEKTGKESNDEKKKDDEGISPAEDLMREHGLFERILLIYEHSIQQFKNSKAIDQQTLNNVAKIVRAFIENYHSKLEEDQVFPRFEKAGKLVELVTILRSQHQAGREITDKVLELTATDKKLDDKNSGMLANSLKQFINMYRPHIAREDTVLFPAMHDIIPRRDYESLGEQFEDREQELFGQNGFEKTVQQIAEIEKTLGIYELSQFSPKKG